jgi:nucleotide-binding universal stress UspA family protein
VSLMQGKVKKILCAVDFSRFSEGAVLDAVLLAGGLDSRVVFLHVVNQAFFEDLDRLGGRVEMYEGAADKAMHNLAGDRREKLNALLIEKRADDIAHTSRVEVGIPWERILETAEKEDADLILMGAKGRGGPERSLRFGGTAEKIFRRARCRVMFVR